MSFSIKQFITGIGLKPVSADPSNPTQGQLQYADGTVRAEGLWRYDGTAWQQVGSGAGSYDIFFQENLETNTASNFTTGQAASPDAVGTGTLGGTLANETSSQISGDRSLKYTMNATAASSNNDFIINDTDIALDAKQKGNFIGISFYYTYTGDDDDIRFFVLDQDDNEITQSDEYIKAASNPTRFSTSVFLPSSDTALRYGFQVVTGNSSKVFIVDDIEFSTNPFVYKDLVEMTEWVDAGAITIDATTTAPTKPTTTITDLVRWRRVGDSMEAVYIFHTTNHTGAAAGSGDYIFRLPSGYEMDSSKVSFYTTVEGGGAWTTGSGTTIGHGSLSDNTNPSQFQAVAYDSTGFRLFGNYTNGTGVASSSYGSLNLVDSLKVKISVPIKGWSASSEHVVTPAKVVDEIVRYSGRAASASGYGSTNTAIPVFSTEEVNTSGELISISNSSTDGFSITALKDCIVTAEWHSQGLSSSKEATVGFSLNSSALINNVRTISESELVSLNNSHDDGANSFLGAGTTATIKLSAGDVLRPHGDANLSTNYAPAGITVHARAAEAQFLAAVPVPLTAYLKDVKSSGTAGGTFTSGSWQTRTLNTVEGDSEIVSLSSNQFTLPKGKYIIEGSAQAHEVVRHKTRIYDVTNSAEAIIGTSSYAINTYIANTASDFSGVIEISSPTTYQLEHRAETTKTSIGFGVPTSFGSDEVYATVKITKIK